MRLLPAALPAGPLPDSSGAGLLIVARKGSRRVAAIVRLTKEEKPRRNAR
ncbi:hypothetical protein [Paenibacillus chitinolyticus]|uniref:Uncharacterized protein n=1 Tax=Paenibacillus chitinolyticus TaxID=79263 RepID=A0ABT4FFI5_9BACL|nr:hypothetical protein [Paenibacillus chitinolyticus]MCY9588704.1 hypothetical protein [Paenibacillus chitinolyticus]MCY9595792.1 hypothetical protein [Paenibacillus chitinolyticus]